MLEIDIFILHKKKYDTVIMELCKLHKKYNLHNPNCSIFEHIKYVKKIKYNYVETKKIKYWKSLYSYYTSTSN